MDKFDTMLDRLREFKIKSIISFLLAGLACALLGLVIAVNPVTAISALLAVIIVIKFPELYLTIFIISILPVFAFWGYSEQLRHFGIYIGALLITVVFLYSSHGKIRVSLNGIVTNLGIPLLTFFLLSCGVMYSDATVYGNQKVLEFAKFCLIPCFLFYLYFRNNSSRIYYLLLFITVFGLIISFEAIQQFSTIGFTPGFRAEAYGINTIWNGRYASISLVATWFLWKIIRKKTYSRKWYILFVIMIIFFTLALIACGSRGPVLALLGSFLVYFVFSRYIIEKVSNVKVLIKRMVGVLAILAFVYVLYTCLPLINPRFDATYLKHDQNTTGRVLMLKRSINGWLDSNIVVGAGTGNFAILWDNTDRRSYPHNIFAEILYENGLLGLTLVVTYIIIAFKSCCKLAYSSPDVAGFIFCGLSISIINACFSGDITSMGNNWIWVLGAVAVALAESKNTAKETSV